MKTRGSSRGADALTLFEVLLVVAVVLMLLSIGLIFLDRARAPHLSNRARCLANLKEAGEAFRAWAMDNADKFPMQISTNANGTRELDAGPYAFRNYQTLRNELKTPKGLVCPTEPDHWRVAATLFRPPVPKSEILFASNTNLSYFAGLDAEPAYPQSILAGDHNLTNGAAIVQYRLDLTTNQPAGWTAAMHELSGNLLFADGSVQSFTTPRLRDALQYTGFETNRLQMP